MALIPLLEHWNTFTDDNRSSPQFMFRYELLQQSMNCSSNTGTAPAIHELLQQYRNCSSNTGTAPALQELLLKFHEWSSNTGIAPAIQELLLKFHELIQQYRNCSSNPGTVPAIHQWTVPAIHEPYHSHPSMNCSSNLSLDPNANKPVFSEINVSHKITTYKELSGDYFAKLGLLIIILNAMVAPTAHRGLTVTTSQPI